MKKIWSVILVAVLCVAFAVPSAMAADPPPKPNQVTQAELAQLLVQVLGLSRFLPPSPSAQQCFAVLLDNGISPKNGWKPDTVVVKSDLARVIVQAMKKQGDILHPEDDTAWIDYLKSIGIPLDAVGETTSYVNPLAEPAVPHVVTARVDPLVKRHKFNPIDETQGGADMAYVVHLLSQFEFVSGAFRPRPVTED